jgi:hypothetical protein
MRRCRPDWNKIAYPNQSRRYRNSDVSKRGIFCTSKAGHDEGFTEGFLEGEAMAATETRACAAHYAP